MPGRSPQFDELAREWRQQRHASSSLTEIAMSPAYQRIIGMGPAVVPLIIEQLRCEGAEPDHWFWALRAITGENPVSPEDQGNMQKMSQAWQAWAERKGYVGLLAAS